MDDDKIILMLVAAIIGCIVLYIKLNKASKLNSDLNLKNNKLNSDNTKLRQENSKLIADNAMLEAEHLKFQLQPHTLGNVVMTINSVAKSLHKGTESLAESLNYILYKGNQHLVSVSDEINFIRKYLDLNQLLYPDSISTKVDDSNVNHNSSSYINPSIPHLISAYLIENAYKHGDKTHPDFLKISLTLSDSIFVMQVVNRINPNAKAPNENGGLGIKNMEKRLELLMTNRYDIKRSCNEQEYHTTLTIHF